MLPGVTQETATNNNNHLKNKKSQNQEGPEAGSVEEQLPFGDRGQVQSPAPPRAEVPRVGRREAGSEGPLVPSHSACAHRDLVSSPAWRPGSREAPHPEGRGPQRARLGGLHPSGEQGRGRGLASGCRSQGDSTFPGFYWDHTLQCWRGRGGRTPGGLGSKLLGAPGTDPATAFLSHRSCSAFV